MRHSESNPGSVAVEEVVELRPALQSKEMFEAFAGLVADGNTTSRGTPRDPLQFGATFWDFRHESRVTSPPIWLQSLMLAPLSALAKVVGVRPYDDRWIVADRGVSTRLLLKVRASAKRKPRTIGSRNARKGCLPR